MAKLRYDHWKPSGDSAVLLRSRDWGEVMDFLESTR